MTDSESARTAATRWTVLAASVAVGAGLVGVLAHQPPASSTSPAAAPPAAAAPARPHGAAGRAGALGEADGAVPDGGTGLGADVPAVTRLDPDLLGALRRAAADAADDGVGFVVNSGWRSAAYQQRLRREAVSEHGSEEEAARWVATADTSAHVSGDAIDIGPADATTWLSEHGAGYGLCRIYGNEPWHYELRPDAVDRGCPPPYPDPTHDPRMQR